MFRKLLFIATSATYIGFNYQVQQGWTYNGEYGVEDRLKIVKAGRINFWPFQIAHPLKDIENCIIENDKFKVTL